MDQKRYSKKQIERAGDKLRSDSLLLDETVFSNTMDILSSWRFSHEVPLERAFAVLQKEVGAVERNPIFGKRLKRQSSISSKLRRFEKMSLKNMQEVAGLLFLARKRSVKS